MSRSNFFYASAIQQPGEAIEPLVGLLRESLLQTLKADGFNHSRAPTTAPSIPGRKISVGKMGPYEYRVTEEYKWVDLRQQFETHVIVDALGV